MLNGVSGLLELAGGGRWSSGLRRRSSPGAALPSSLEVISASFGGPARAARAAGTQPAGSSGAGRRGKAAAAGGQEAAPGRARAKRWPGAGPINAVAEASRAARGPGRRVLTRAPPPPGLPAIRGPSRGAPRGAPVSPAPVLFKGVRWLGGGSWPRVLEAAVGRAEASAPILYCEGRRRDGAIDYC